jgi:hypothetical protein
VSELEPGELFLAPDVGGTIDAWRVWRVWRGVRDGVYVLGSAIKPTLWPARQPLLAECLRRRPLAWVRRKQRHAAPDAPCECGVYAVALEQLGLYLNGSSLQPDATRVVGQVALWGTVVECERGFRASHAYPLRIFVPSDVCGGRDRASELVDGLAAYGVPIELLSAPRSGALEALASRAG